MAQKPSLTSRMRARAKSAAEQLEQMSQLKKSVGLVTVLAGAHYSQKVYKQKQQEKARRAQAQGWMLRKVPIIGDSVPMFTWEKGMKCLAMTTFDVLDTNVAELVVAEVDGTTATFQTSYNVKCTDQDGPTQTIIFDKTVDIKCLTLERECNNDGMWLHILPNAPAQPDTPTIGTLRIIPLQDDNTWKPLQDFTQNTSNVVLLLSPLLLTIDVMETAQPRDETTLEQFDNFFTTSCCCSGNIQVEGTNHFFMSTHDALKLTLSSDKNTITCELSPNDHRTTRTIKVSANFLRFGIKK